MQWDEYLYDTKHTPFYVVHFLKPTCNVRLVWVLRLKGGGFVAFTISQATNSIGSGVFQALKLLWDESFLDHHKRIMCITHVLWYDASYKCTCMWNNYTIHMIVGDDEDYTMIDDLSIPNHLPSKHGKPLPPLSSEYTSGLYSTSYIIVFNAACVSNICYLQVAMTLLILCCWNVSLGLICAFQYFILPEISCTSKQGVYCSK